MPENTLESFQRALNQGADVLETDLRISSDDQLILIHDETLDRTTNGSGPVTQHSLNDIKRYRTLTPAGELSTEAVPTLLELLQMTQGAVPLLLELKDPLFAEETYARLLADTLAAYGMIERTAVVSFNRALVESLALVCPSLPTGLITLKELRPKRGITLFGPAWPLLFANPFYVASAHRMGSIVAPLDTCPEKRMWYYQLLGVDAVLTNTPASAVAMLK